VASLLDKSLLSRREATGEPRFRMLETVREFALERLAEDADTESLRRAHAAWFHNLAERAAPELVGPEQEAWLEQLEADHQNLRAAIAWAVAHGEAETALRLGTALWLFWHIHGHLAEGRSWLERATAQGAGAPPAVLAKALHRLGNLVVSMGDYAEARTCYAASLKLARELGDPRAIADALSGLGLARADQGDRAGARPPHEEALALRRAAGDRAGVAISLTNLGDIAAAEGDIATARDHYGQVLTVWEELGDANGAAYATARLGRTARYGNDLDTAEALCGESLAQFLAMGDRAGQAFATHDLAWVAHRCGDDGLAAARFADELALCHDIHDKAGLPDGGDRKGWPRSPPTSGCTDPRRACWRRPRQSDVRWVCPCRRPTRPGPLRRSPTSGARWAGRRSTTRGPGG